MAPHVVLLFLLAASARAMPVSPRLASWVDAAQRLARANTCEEAPFAGERECKNLWHVPTENMTVYAAEAIAGARLTTVLPDGSLSRAGNHDAVLVIDPFPNASFGHLVLVYFVDLKTSEEQCNAVNGHYLGNGECMSQAVKNRCHNLLEKKSRRKNLARRCEIQFLPLVYDENDVQVPKEQKLRCRNDIPGFAPCPTLRPRNATSSLVCNPLHVNTQRCSTTHETVHTRCRLFEICDQAVVVAGGWNREHSPTRTSKTVKDVFYTLRDAGFQRSNIKVFYVNGAKSSEVLGEDHPVMYPAPMKLAMRYHIQRMCSSPHCVDSLVLYLNSPARTDGSMLLWDVDGNGLVDETEVYTVKELLTDLKECVARRVYIIIDQSYSGEIVKAFARSRKHSNVVVFASGKDNEYSWDTEFTRHWTNYKNMQTTCVNKVHEESLHSVILSNPTTHDGSNGSIKTTLFGAPCDVTPPYTTKELQDNYWGCQNLPTRVWMSKYNP